MRKILISYIIAGLLAPLYLAHARDYKNDPTKTPANAYSKLYQELNAPVKPTFDAYQMAMAGYGKLKLDGKLQNDRYLTVIDFSLSANQKRLWLIDMELNQVIKHIYVSHGRKSGNEYAKKFSNVANSNQSSIGMYLTGETYYGKHGLSLRLDGLEKGYNDNARRRAIVIHGAKYANPDFITRYGRLGRSLGCPALPLKDSKEVIETIKDKSALFIYYPDQKYLSDSELTRI